MKKNVQIYVLVALGIVLVYVGYTTFFGRNDVPGISSVNASDTNFQPLDVQEPQLRLDLLARIQKSEYSGTHRNVFLIGPIAQPGAPVAPKNVPPPFVGPRMPPPPPPLQVPGEFFGYAQTRSNSHRVAFYKNGDDVSVLEEGDKFLGGLRLLHISDNSVEIEEVASGRRTSVPMTQPAPEQNQNP